MWDFGQMTGSTLDDWYQELAPSKIILHNVKTGGQIEELSLVAVKVQPVDSAEKDPETGADITVRRMVTKQYIAAGRAAREFEDTADVMVFSPLRDGQIAQYSATIYLLRSLLKRMLTKFQLFRPVLCIRAQERITEVEEKALIDAGIQLGARKVYLYKGSLSVLLSDVPKWLRNGYIIHIEPQE